MTMTDICKFALAGLAAAMLSPLAAMGQTSADLDRISVNEKGSLLMWSEFWVSVLDQGTSGDLVSTDTVLQFTNDSPDAVDVQFYVASPVWIEVPGEPGGDGPGFEVVWRNFDIGVTLTGNQSAWWSLATGDGTFSGMPSLTDHFGYQSNGSGLVGYVYAWATGVSDGSENVEITHNHLSGTATTISYGSGWAFETSAWTAARATDAGGGDAILNLDGNEYDTCFSHLLYTFYATGDFSAEGDPTEASQTSSFLTLHVVDANFDADVAGDGSYRTKAHFDIWNEYEIKFSGQYRCIDCWDRGFTPVYNIQGGPNHMLRENLGTPVGKARITSVSDTVLCEGNGDGGEFALLGVESTGFGLASNNVLVTANNLVGMGERAAVITYPLLDVPPVAPEGPVGAMDAFLGDIKKAARSSK